MAMAEELSLEPDTFSVDVHWPAAPEAGGNELLDASIARFEIKAGATVLHAGEDINVAMIATLASFGYGRVKVGGRPRVAIMATGSELV